MGTQIETWENAVLRRAYEALKTPTLGMASGMASGMTSGITATVEERVFEQAYTYCAQLTRASSRTFYLASCLLPEKKRRAARALYAFCRATDDMIDQVAHFEDARRLLDDWRERVARPPNVYDPIPLAWADTKARYRIPHGYEAQLIDGIARDLRQQRYATFAELADYCYGVASTVGLMVMHIVHFQSEDALPYAVKLGIALQLTNILRDVGVDWQAGRLYLPLDELAGFGLSEDDVAGGVVDDRWRALMRYQIARARALYAEAERGIALLDADGRFAIAAAADLYRAILADIETHDYDVFHRRAHLGAWGKLRRLPDVWWATRRPVRS